MAAKLLLQIGCASRQGNESLVGRGEPSTVRFNYCKSCLFLLSCDHPMKQRRYQRPALACINWTLSLSLSALISVISGTAADFTVTATPAVLAYTINTVPSTPTITLVRGETYTFAINTSSSHPFQILSPAGTTINNNISSGTLTFMVPTNAVNYSYRCSFHFFGNTIITIPPPDVRIVNFAIGTNLVLTSTGTNNWKVVPEFSTNLNESNWLPLTIQSNNFANGTNETFCGTPPGTNVFIRIKALRQ